VTQTLNTLLPVEDQLEIMRIISKSVQLADAHAWDRLGEVYSNPTRLDYSALLGDEPVSLSPGALGQRWQAEIGGTDASLHQLTNFVIVPDGAGGAACDVSLNALHWYEKATDGALYQVCGLYAFGLRRTVDGWRIASQKITPYFHIGNRDLLHESAAAAARTERRATTPMS
jgi:hypothetical protein